MTTLKLDVAPKKPRFARPTSFGENLMRGFRLSFEDPAKCGMGRGQTSILGKKNATFPRRGVQKASSFKSKTSILGKNNATFPRRGIQEASSSFKSKRRQGVNRASSNSSKSGLKNQRVSFGEEHIHTIECVCPDLKADLWYTKDQLKDLTKIELRLNLASQLNLRGNKNSSIEDNECITWRGMEDLEKGGAVKESIKNYIRTILLEHHLDTPSEEIRELAMSMSKVARDRARSMGLQDEADARPPSKIGGHTLIGRTMSGSRKLINLMASNKIQATAA